MERSAADSSSEPLAMAPAAVMDELLLKSLCFLASPGTYFAGGKNAASSFNLVREPRKKC